MPAGRPSIYTPALAKEICDRIAKGRTTLSVSKDEDMPNLSTIYDWRDDGKHKEFSAMYAQAREKLCMHWADEVLDCADNETRDYSDKVTEHIGKDGDIYKVETERKSDNTAVQRDRLRTDSRKWLLSKLRPSEYGDRSAVELTGANGAPLMAALNISIARPSNDLPLPALAIAHNGTEPTKD